MVRTRTTVGASPALHVLPTPAGTTVHSPEASVAAGAPPVAARSTDPSLTTAMSVPSPAGSMSVAPGARNIQPSVRIGCAGVPISTPAARTRAETPAGDGRAPPNASGIAATVQDAAAAALFCGHSPSRTLEMTTTRATTGVGPVLASV